MMLRVVYHLCSQADNHGLSENPDDYKVTNGTGKAEPPALPTDDTAKARAPLFPTCSPAMSRRPWHICSVPVQCHGAG
jgi:hypothetical protein